MGNRGVNLKKHEKLNLKSKNEIFSVSIKLVLVHVAFLVDMCTRQHDMQDDSSAAVPEHLDEKTILMDVCKIQRQSVHFDELGDVFVRFMKIQGRI